MGGGALSGYYLVLNIGGAGLYDEITHEGALWFAPSRSFLLVGTRLIWYTGTK